MSALTEEARRLAKEADRECGIATFRPHWAICIEKLCDAIEALERRGSVPPIETARFGGVR